MKKLIIASLLLLFAYISPAYAQSDDFYFSLRSEYNIKNDGLTDITHSVEIQNQKTETYAPSFSLNLSGGKLEDIEAYESGVALPVKVEQDGAMTRITVDFIEAVVGRGARRKFVIQMKDRTVAVKSGDIWEIAIPRLDNVDQYLDVRAKVVVPADFGELASVSPDPDATDKTSFEFRNKKLLEPITAAFGKFQVYTVSLEYELENESGTTVHESVAIPPDTSYQKVHIEQINPKPDNVTVDIDGNWLAHYTLAPRTRIHITLSGFVQVFNESRTLVPPSEEALALSTKQSTYWELNDPEVAAQARKLVTPRDIYDFVVSHLSYDYDRVNPQLTRLGAKVALQKPDEALCQEFTDLFIALARARGIPAREINGYGVTTDSKLTPLSLIEDVLHAWPEYWDYEQKKWIAVDPTWGKTSGTDYFSEMDLKHITFVIHGQYPDKPLPPGSKPNGDAKKYIHVSVSELTPLVMMSPVLTLIDAANFPAFSYPLRFTIENTSKNALYNQEIQLSSQQGVIEKVLIPVLPPFGNYSHEARLKTGLFGRSLPTTATLSVGFDIQEIPINPSKVVMVHLPPLLGLFLIVTYIIARALKNVRP